MMTYPPQQFSPLSPFGWSAPSQTFTPAAIGSAAGIPNMAQTLQQIVQLLQIVPNQLQQLQQAQYVQHHQLQQLLQVIPAQLQQLVQFVPQQIQSGAPFQQPFGQVQGNSGYGVATPWGIAPPAVGAQPSQVM